MLDLFGDEYEPIEEKPLTFGVNGNPCIALYGPGADNQTCKGCVHLRYQSSANKRYWKCDLRKLTHGHATDHKVRWQACGRYERRTEEYHGG